MLRLGADAKVKLRITNPTDVPFEILVAKENGKAASDDVRLMLKNTSGDVIAVQPVQLSLGDVINIFGGLTVIRVPENSEIITPELTIPVPLDADNSANNSANNKDTHLNF